MKKSAKLPRRSFQITDEERLAARQSISAFNDFLRKLKGAREADKKLVNVLEKNKDADSTKIFEIRHLLRRFQASVKERYSNLVYLFAGKKDIQNNLISSGVIHTLAPLEKDTNTAQIKTAIQDAFQELVEFIEEFLEKFEAFGSETQIADIIATSKKADQIVQSIENVIEKQLRQHFEKNIMGRKISQIVGGIRRRARLIEMLEK